jgi:hypothetical protein
MITMSSAMQRPLLKSVIIGSLLALTTLLSGCGAMRFAYGQGTDLSYWWLDGYADFDEEQTLKLRGALDAWFAWHRTTQLPDYARFLAQVQLQATEAVTPAQVCRLYDEAFSRLDPMLERAYPPAVELVQSLTLQQIAHIERKYAKVNREFRSDHLQEDPAERLQKSFDRAVKRAEMFYGDLDPPQLDALKKGVAASPLDAQLWYHERVLRQQDALKTLRRLVTERASAEQTQAALRVLVRNVRQSPRDAYASYQKRVQQHNCMLTAQLHNSASREQRLAAVKKLKSYEEDARALAADAR